ncbi:MAG: M56 family metallopeptidase [Bacteroidota bacterium]
MPFLFIYLIKLSVSLAAVFLFYHFVLRKLTFYNWNRWYLLGYSLLSFFIPFIDISKVLQENEWTENSIVQWVPVIHSSVSTINKNSTPHSFTAWNLISLLIIAGITIMLVRLLLQFISFRRLVRKAEPIAIGLLPGSGMKLYQVEGNIIPFSFGNSIFINHHLHTREELQEIVWHEFIHVKQKHSLDIICGELLCLLNWYNPFAWLLRLSIRQNLEFIADNKVLENGIARKEYQYLLLKVIGNNHFSIAPKFNFSSLKKRIAMMNKMKSAGVHVVKFLFILPFVAVLLLAFRNNYQSGQQKTAGVTGRDTIPEVRLPAAISSISLMDNTITTTTDPVLHKMQGMVVVKRKDGQKEIYDLYDKDNMNSFEKKYGMKLEELIPPPPPAPPVPPTPAEGLIPAIPPVPPVPPTPPSKENSVTAITPGVQEAGSGINLRGISSEYEITDKKATIKLKDGSIENYDLTSKKDCDVFEKKYGRIVRVNANVNTNVNTIIAANVKTNINTNVNANTNTDVRATVSANVNANVNTNINTTIKCDKTLAPLSPALITTLSPLSSGTNAYAPLVTPASLVTSVRPIQGFGSLTPGPSSLLSVVDDYGYVITGKEDIIITITRKTTRQELEKIIIQMGEKGVDLAFDEIEYNDKGMLVTITGTMKSGGSRSKFVASDFDRLILAMIKKGDKTYFKVSTRDNKEVI